jgi:hypothetical protein
MVNKPQRSSHPHRLRPSSPKLSNLRFSSPRVNSLKLSSQPITSSRVRRLHPER